LEKEVYTTTIGIFRMVTDLERANLVQVQLLISGRVGDRNEAWENVGIMKRKEFIKMIRPHKAKKLQLPESSDSFWSGYQQV